MLALCLCDAGCDDYEEFMAGMQAGLKKNSVLVVMANHGMRKRLAAVTGPPVAVDASRCVFA